MGKPTGGTASLEEQLEAALSRVAELEESLAAEEKRYSRQAKQIRVVRRLGGALARIYDQETLLENIVAQVMDLIAAERCHVFILDQTSDELWAVAANDKRGLKLRFRVGEGIVGHVAQTGTAVNLEDARHHPGFDPRLEEWLGADVTSLMAVPLLNYDGRVIGAIEVVNRGGEEIAFTEEDEELLAAVAVHTGAAIDKAKLFFDMLSKDIELGDVQAKLRNKMEELDILYRIEKELTRTDDLDSLLVGIMRHAVQIVPAEVGAVCLSQGTVEVVNIWHRDEECAEKLRLEAGTGLIGQVSRHGRAMLANDIPEHPDLARLTSERLGRDAISALVVPLFLRGTPSGALALYNKTGSRRSFEDDDRKLLVLMAGQTATAIERIDERRRELDANRLATVGRLLSGVLHDFRTPMSIIAGYAHLMAEEDNPDERRQSASSILKQIEMINQMTREILLFARGEQSLLVRRVQMVTFLDEISELLQEEFAGYGIELTIEREYLGPVRMDETKMRRVVFNLARNAREAMPEGGRFVFQVAHDPDSDEILYRFCDTGDGVPDDVRDKLFSSFVTSGKQDGTGLGLAIVKRIVEEHGGRISYESQRNIGTTFTIRIPREGPLDSVEGP